MADILLVYPKAGHDIRGVSVNAPLAVLTLAAILKPHFSVEIIDQRAVDNFWDKLKSSLAKNPLLVGLSSMTGTQIYHSIEISKFVKQHSDSPVVWGGMHPTIYSAQTIAKPYIDFVIKGEGENALLALAETLSKNNRRFDLVPALTWKYKGEIFGSALADPLNIDKSPPLPWHMVDVEEYTSPTQFLYEGVSRLLPFQGSRGCPFKCTFCSEPALTRQYRMMDPEKMVEECVEMTKKYKLDHIAFFDEEFFVNTKWATRVAEIIDGQFSWWAQTRAADLVRVDLKKMEKCGLLIVAPGLESGSNRVLKFIRKGETIDEYLHANQELKKTKIQAQYNFIIGYPTETKKERDETVDLVLELMKTNKRALVNQLSPLTPLPGTQLLNQAIHSYGMKEATRLEEWIFATRGKQERPWLSRKDLRHIRFLYYSSYFICSAERYTKKFKIPKWVLSLYTWCVKIRWEKKWYAIDFDIAILRILFRYFVNPIDYTLSESYGDQFTAKESDIKSGKSYLEALIDSFKENQAQKNNEAASLTSTWYKTR